MKLAKNNAVTDFMLNRRSVLVKNMVEPGPNAAELETILTIATRVPDHRKLEPWRFLILQDNDRSDFGRTLAAVKAKKENMSDIQVKIEKECFLRAPLIIAVIASPVEHKTPEVEQILSAGAVDAQQAIGLKKDEFVAGYLYIGSSDEQPQDRQRPDLQNKVIHWNQLKT